MKKVISTLAILLLAVCLFAQSEDNPPRNNWGAKLKESNFHLGLDFQSKYVWRGMEMITENAAPVLFPCINYSNKGFYVYVLGGYAVNGKYSELDFGISYTYKWFTIGINDYYYPTTTTPIDRYFNYKPHETGHWLEAVITISPEKIPLWLKYQVADEEGNTKDKQAYSTYAELGTYYDFLHNHKISLALGAAFDKSCYNGYEKNFSICNIELKYLYNLTIKDFSLPLGAALIYNPVYNKAFVNFTASLAF